LLLELCVAVVLTLPPPDCSPLSVMLIDGVRNELLFG
jgi:hypothetical protein